MSTDEKQEIQKISIREFIENSPAELNITVLAGENSISDRYITSERIQKLGLALAGFAHYIRPGRIQLVGQSEILYLSQLGKKKRAEALAHLEHEKISCILIAKNLAPVEELKNFCASRGIPILHTPLVSSNTITVLTNYLQERLAPQITLHGVLLGIYNIGVLITGDSGIGKSECALDLITRGHILVSDDAVTIKKIGGRLDGEAPELIYEHLEIRGLGIINIRDLFGVSAVTKRKKIELCIKLKKWSESENIERTGLEIEEEKIFGVKLPQVTLPVSPGRNLSTLVETAVRVHLLRQQGFDAAQKLIEKHSALINGR